MSPNKKVALTTLGCKLNQYDSEVILTQFRAGGYEVTENPSEADVCVVNSCAVTGAAERKTRNALRSMHRASPNAALLAVGCTAERSPESLAHIPGVSAVLGNNEKQRILDFLSADRNGDLPEIHVGETSTTKEWTDGLVVEGLLGRTRSFLKVQDGCSQRCTYCVIPRLRGVGRSLPIKEIGEKARRLVDNGFVEIVITGVALGTYGFDLDMPDGLAQMLAALERVPGLHRIRLGSVEPWAVTTKMLNIVADSERICPHLHIPLQSGEDTVLHRMNRRYDTKDIRAIFDTAYSLRDDWGFGSDIIVGFPGEGESEFRMTRELLSELPLSYLHVFPFSARPGTPATKLGDHVGESEKQERVRSLRDLDHQLRLKFRKRNLGTIQHVLIEQRKVGSYFAGHSKNYLDVFAPAAQELVGTVQQMRIVELHSDGVVGEIAS